LKRPNRHAVYSRPCPRKGEKSPAIRTASNEESFMWRM
jgi:hypothetical protein